MRWPCTSPHAHLVQSPGRARTTPMKPIEKLRWSPDHRKWLCHDDVLIDQILKSDRFAVPNYDHAALGKKVGHAFPVSNEVIAHFPLAHEGDRHQALKARMNLDVQTHFKAAIATFVSGLQERLAVLGDARGETDIAQPLIEAVLASNLVLAGMTLPADVNYSDLTFMLDDRQSIKSRLRREAFAQSLSTQMGECDQPYKLALISVGINALLSSLLNTLVKVLANQGFQGLSDAKFFTATGIQYLERVCVQPVQIDGHDIQPGDQVRVYLTACENADLTDMVRNRRFFGLDTPHACVGMNYSLNIWKATTQTLVEHFTDLNIISVDFRPQDGVFHCPDRIRVEYFR